MPMSVVSSAWDRGKRRNCLQGPKELVRVLTAVVCLLVPLRITRRVLLLLLLLLLLTALLKHLFEDVEASDLYTEKHRRDVDENGQSRHAKDVIPGC